GSIIGSELSSNDGFVEPKDPSANRKTEFLSVLEEDPHLEREGLSPTGDPHILHLLWEESSAWQKEKAGLVQELDERQTEMSRLIALNKRLLEENSSLRRNQQLVDQTNLLLEEKNSSQNIELITMKAEQEVKELELGALEEEIDKLNKDK